MLLNIDKILPERVEREATTIYYAREGRQQQLCALYIVGEQIQRLLLMLRDSVIIQKVNCSIYQVSKPSGTL